jgi:hypothetical protein
MPEPAAATHSSFPPLPHRFNNVILGSVAAQDRNFSLRQIIGQKLTKNVINVCGEVNQRLREVGEVGTRLLLLATVHSLSWG